MAISGLIKKLANQDAVYWGNPVNDGQGNINYDAPVPIKVRWDEKLKLVPHVNLSTKQGENLVSTVSILTPETLVVGGRLYLGLLTDLDSDGNWESLGSLAHVIIGKDKAFMPKSLTQSVTTYYL